MSLNDEPINDPPGGGPTATLESTVITTLCPAASVPKDHLASLLGKHAPPQPVVTSGSASISFVFNR